MSRSQTSIFTSSRWIAALTLGVAVPLLASLAAAQSRRGQQSPQPPSQREADGAQKISGRERPARGDDREDGGARRGGSPRQLSEQEIDKVIATAREIDASWAEMLEKMRAKDPVKLRERIGMVAGKLMGLSMLRERQPELYQVRVESFRLQRQIRKVIDQLAQARESKDQATEAVTLIQAQQLAGTLVDLELKARAYELVAIDKALKESRLKLQRDITERELRVQTTMQEIERGEMPKFGRPPEMPFGGEGMRSPWSRGEQGDQRDQRDQHDQRDQGNPNEPRRGDAGDQGRLKSVEAPAAPQANP